MSRAEEMNLILGATPEASWQSLNVFFEHTGWIVSAENWQTCYLDGEAHLTEGERYLLLHSNPEEAIAHTIADGAHPEQAREAWVTAAKAMVNFYKRHRKQAVMVSIPNLLADPKAQLTTIADQLSLAEPGLPTTTPQVERAPLLERLVASQILHKTPGITALLAQIETCTLPLPGHSCSEPDLDLNAANCQLVSLRANLAKSEQLAVRLKQESAQYLAANKNAETAYKADLNQKLETLRSEEAAYRKLGEELANQKQQHVTELVRRKKEALELRTQLSGVTLRTQQTREESSQLLEQLHLVQEALEAKFISNSKLQRQLVQIEAQSKTEQQEKQRAEKTLEQTEQKRKAREAEFKEELNQTLAKLRSADDAYRKLEEKLARQQQQAAELARQKEQQAEKTLQEYEQKRRDVEAAFKEDANQTIEKLRSADDAYRKLEEELSGQQQAAELARHKEQQAKKALEQYEQKRSKVEAEYKEELKQTLATLRGAEDKHRKLESELAEYRKQQDQALLAADQQIQRLQTELNSFKSGIAFKATAPVRVLKARLRVNREKNALKKPAELVKRSGLFDVVWYLKTYPDVAEKGMDPIFHYLKFGAEERRNPSPEFDTDWYLISHSDVAEAGVNPLIHYIKFGQQEGRSISRDNHQSLLTLRAA